MSDFEKWVEDYALRYEPDYTAKHEIDCKAAFEAGMEAARQAPASGEVEPAVWIDPEDAKRTMIACPGERADVSPCREGRFSMPLYTNPPAKVPEGKNDFGLDARYFHEKLGLILRDIRSYTPSEMARALGRLAITASDVTMREAEFQIGDIADQPKYRDATPAPPAPPQEQ